MNKENYNFILFAMVAGSFLFSECKCFRSKFKKKKHDIKQDNPVDR